EDATGGRDGAGSWRQHNGDGPAGRRDLLAAFWPGGSGFGGGDGPPAAWRDGGATKGEPESPGGPVQLAGRACSAVPARDPQRTHGWVTAKSRRPWSFLPGLGAISAGGAGASTARDVAGRAGTFGGARPGNCARNAGTRGHSQWHRGAGGTALGLRRRARGPGRLSPAARPS